eukprot:scaffold520_cov224-Pinguiococcus_pyrenoidosus.AAC.12
MPVAKTTLSSSPVDTEKATVLPRPSLRSGRSRTTRCSSNWAADTLIRRSERAAAMAGAPCTTECSPKRMAFPGALATQ